MTTAAGGLARRRLLGVLTGGVPAQCCSAVAELGVPDLLAAGPRPVTELAAECGADPSALRRLLRGLTAMGVFRHEEPDAFALTSVGELLRADVPGSLRSTAILHGDVVARAFTEITSTLRTGRPAFERTHGVPFYDHLAAHPDVARTFAAAMGGEPVPAVLASVELPAGAVVVDVGGGDGGLLADVLARHPGARGVLVELPDSARAAAERLAAAGLADRCDVVAGDFFAAVPPGGDVYVLARVLHNWADERAEAILRRVAAAMRPGARLLVVEKLLPATTDAPGAAAAMLVDLLMLGLMEGHDRTEVEYVALLDKAGFDVAAVTPGGGAADGLIEAVPR